MVENNHGAGVEFDTGWGYFVRADCPIHGFGLKLDQKAQLAHTSNPHSLVNPEPSNPLNYVE